MKLIFKIFLTLAAILMFSELTFGQSNTDAKSKDLLTALININGGWEKLGN